MSEKNDLGEQVNFLLSISKLKTLNKLTYTLPEGEKQKRINKLIAEYEGKYKVLFGSSIGVNI
ncbi:MAG: hypothetical protein KKF48_02845 [Nanoarchaeota archaeon]|nr:hypothetical protein [Nanoarchaeota archaeon]MBU1027960.1 hypothetical protein [Nanoarchaeota archaeon]